MLHLNLRSQAERLRKTVLVQRQLYPTQADREMSTNLTCKWGHITDFFPLDLSCSSRPRQQEASGSSESSSPVGAKRICGAVAPEIPAE